MKRCFILIKELPLINFYSTPRIIGIIDCQEPIELKLRQITPVVVDDDITKLKLRIPKLRRKDYTFTINTSGFEKEGLNLIEISFNRNWYWKLSKLFELIPLMVLILIFLNNISGKEYSDFITIFITILATLFLIDILIKIFKPHTLELKILAI